MGTDGREQELAAVTPEQIVDFVDRMAYWRGSAISPGDVTYHNFTLADGRILGLAKRALDTLLLWRQEAGPKLALEAFVAMLDQKLKTAVVDKEAGRVEFRFTGAELIELRGAVGLLQDFALIKERDAREASRPKYPKRKK